MQKISKALGQSDNKWVVVKGDIADKGIIDSLFNDYKFAVVINLTPQAEVRYSIDCSETYIHSNLVGFFYILKACRHSYDDGKRGVEHLIYASSSSVYGGNVKIPFSTDDQVYYPVSLYAEKKSDEFLAHAYSKRYNIPSTVLRFFTVYGPVGRTDIVLF